MKESKIEEGIRCNMTGSSNFVPRSLPVFYGKLFHNWRVKMQAVFGFQDVIEVVTVGFVEPGRNATEEQILIFKQQQKQDSKARFFIYQCVNLKIFNKISNASTSKEAWEILVKTYGDGEKNKKNSRTSQCNKSLQGVVDKILRTLPPEFDYVAAAIEESNDLDTVEVEELQHSLEAHEMRVNKRKVLKEQALQARTNYKRKDKGPWKHQSETPRLEFGETSESSKERRTHQAQKQGCSSKNSKEWKFDKRNMRCHNCQKLGHYARECWVGEGAKNKPNNRAHLAKDEGTDSEAMLRDQELFQDLTVNIEGELINSALIIEAEPVEFEKVRRSG
ncbi:hypothetical protein CR513_37052, partial [Mucuna pruriens]